MNKSRRAGAAFTLSVVMLFCSQITSASVQPTSNPDLSMGLSLFNDICKQSAAKNVLFSPSSAYAALAMSANGAAGNTQKQILQALGKASMAELKQQMKETQLKAKEENPGVELQSANAIFVDSNAPVLPSFVESSKKIFTAEVSSEKFGNQATVDKINQWCSKQTHGKINSIVDSLSADDLMVLINALYFKGKWEHPFAPAETEPGQFNLPDKTSETVSLMYQQGVFPFYGGTGFTSISMPYVGGEIQMYLFLPNKDSSAAAFRTQLTAKNWKNWMASYKPASVDVSVPKFKIQCKRKLNDSLKQLKMTDAFDESAANFSNMFKPKTKRAHIGFILQKTYIDVNEEGAEAAAVTESSMAKGIFEQPPRPKQFIVDRPFYFALTNSKTEQVLFLGSITDPLAK